jgi:hypothetical protein
LTDVGANEFVIADAIRLERLGALHAASVAEPGSTGVAGLMETDVSRVFDAAVGYWSSTDATAALRLSDTQVVIADLPPTILGLASAWTQTVWLDADAAGFGWQVEAESRERRAESLTPEPRTLNPEPRALNPEHYDLLTVLTHELGHVLGYDDLDPLSGPPSIMRGVLSAGTRRVPAGGASGLVPSTLDSQLSTLDSQLSTTDAFFAELGVGRRLLGTRSWSAEAESGRPGAESQDERPRSKDQGPSARSDGLLLETRRSRVTRSKEAEVDEWFAEFETLDAEES